MFFTKRSLKNPMDGFANYGITYKGGSIFVPEASKDLKNDLLFFIDLLNQSMLIVYKQLNDKQRIIFFEASNILREEDTSLNKLAERISKKRSISFSTTKWNLTKLRDMGLFATNGSRGNTKTTTELTDLGATMSKMLTIKKK
ncbi:MAG: hypothetical protein KAS95_00785 [Candidatus Heimdallarchaeota archaeon]|nr:hypothetical protein [Candidatus Heimdallarchaeota archaeon]